MFSLGVRLRSLILELAQTGLFRARWSEDIHREWMNAAVTRSNREITVDDLEPTRRAMDQAVLDCLVTGYEPLISGLKLPDPGDRHVLAAAIAGKASAIVTFNLKDFPEALIASFGLHVKHPDDFLLDIASIDSESFFEAVERDRAHYKNPPIEIDEYIGTLDRAWVKKTAKLIMDSRIILAATETGTGGD